MQIPPQEIWDKVCVELGNTLSQGVFNTWISPNTLTEVSVENNTLHCVLVVPSPFHISILEKSFKKSIQDAIFNYTQMEAVIEMRVGSTATTPKKESSTKPTVPQLKTAQSATVKQQPSSPTTFQKPNSMPPFSPSVDSLFSENSFAQAEVDLVDHKIRQAGLNKYYTFDNFAVSSTNEMAHAAAVAVSQNPGKAYNVLFLYGGVGVGKTHLMQAVGQNILRNNPDFTLLYRTGEEFMNEIVEAIQTKKTIQLKQKYRSVQVLLIDDIQFMAGKRSMQEEFFHTFNAVIKSRGQVILTSDRAPHEIHPLDDRITSRLEGGLIIDIQQPSFELRTAIVLIKAKQIDFPLPMDFAQKIAASITSTRKLEGVVKAVHSEHILRRQPITQELIQGLLNKHSSEESAELKISAKPQEIIKTIANQFHIKQIDIRGPKRNKEITNARHIAMFILKDELNLPLAEIGRHFGGRDHTSVMHAVKKIELSLQKDMDLRTQVQAIKTSLSGAIVSPTV